MGYTLNGIDLSIYGFTPGRAEGSNLAVSGCWDMPARIGKVWHSWGDENGVEPYVDAEDIRYGGRDIYLHGLIQGTSEEDTLNKCTTLYNLCDSFSDLVQLSCPWGLWQVYIKEQIKVTYLNHGVAKILIPFREPVVDMSGLNVTYLPLLLGEEAMSDNSDSLILVGTPGATFSIDGVTMFDLGLILMKIQDQMSRPATKPFETTSYQNEGFHISKVQQPQIYIKALINQPDYDHFIGLINSLLKMFSKPGLHYIARQNDALRDFFLKDGFTVRNVNVLENSVSAVVEMSLTEVYSNTNWGVLTNSAGGVIKTEVGNIIIT